MGERRISTDTQLEGMQSRPGQIEANTTLGMRFKKVIYDYVYDTQNPLDTRPEQMYEAGMEALIALNVLAVVLATEESLYNAYQGVFDAFEVVSVLVFTIEYLLRLWVCKLDPRYSSSLGRLHWAVTPIAIVDLFAFLPFYLPLQGLDLRFVRMVRLIRIFRVLKIGHYSQSLASLGEVIRAKKEQLIVTAFACLILLIVGSSVVYLVERESQPDTFSSIPSAMWWGAVTLTTVGYGDVYPKTALGKLIGAMFAVMGIGMFALPAGIVASGFAERLSQKRTVHRCPHCGKEIRDEDL